MTIKEQNDLIVLGARWGARAAEQISRAGGSPRSVMEYFKDDLIATMVRNSLEIDYRGNKLR